jgi:hypothetical protein
MTPECPDCGEPADLCDCEGPCSECGADAGERHDYHCSVGALAEGTEGPCSDCGADLPAGEPHDDLCCASGADAIDREEDDSD